MKFNVLASAMVLAIVCGGAFAGNASPVHKISGAKPNAVPVFRSTGNIYRDKVLLRLAALRVKYASKPFTQGEIDRLFNGRIYGGTNATSLDNPFQVALLKKAETDNYKAQFCGGTLVKADVVVTAAHCSDDWVTAEGVEVLYGTRDLKNGGTRYSVERIDVHPDWNTDTMDYDVAVWKLSTPVAGAQLATLATRTPASGTNLLVTGWGKMSNLKYPSLLQKATVPVISTTTCNGSKSYNGDITASMLCAGYMNQAIDSCAGDSGGPLAQGSTLVGIVSWGNGCAKKNLPGVYAKVSNSSVYDFIVEKAGL